MKKLLLPLVIAIILVLLPIAVVMGYMIFNLNIPLLILIILVGLFVIEFLFYYHEIYFSQENKNGKKINLSITPIEEMSLSEKFKVVLKTRNFEIELFWRRSNYFLVLNTAIAVGFISLIKKGVDMDVGMDVYAESYIYALFFCAIGLVVCIAWFKVNLGSKFWQSHWEEILTNLASDMEVDYFAASDNNKKRVMANLKKPSTPLEKYYNYLVLEKPSVSKWMTFLSCFFILVWFCVGGFISYKIGQESILIIWVLSWFVVRGFFGLLNIISKL